MADQFFWLFLTCSVYVLCEKIWQLANRKAYLTPPATTLLVLIVVMLVGKFDYQNYYNKTILITFLLMPATVALAFPIFRQWRRLKIIWRPVILITVFGALTASLTAVGFAKLLGADRVIVIAAVVKSITTPIALAEAAKFAGDLSIVAVVVFIVGTVGGITAPYVLNLFGIRRPLLRGLLYGITAHGLGTAMAMMEDKETGAFAGLALGLCGIITALLVPLIIFAFNI